MLVGPWAKCGFNPVSQEFFMRRILFVAEKNDVAKGVASILSRGQMTRREGKSKFNKIYELHANILGQSARLSVTSVSGHLMEWQFGNEMKDWQNVPIGSLFEAPIYQKVNENMKLIAVTLQEEAKKCDVLVIWTDCDREGENIGAEIAKTCMQANRNLDIYRAKFSEITPHAIENATRNLSRLDARIVDAVDCRQELDLRIGAAFTRLQTLHLREKYPQILGGDNKQVISYGSCQFPTLGFVVERYKNIQQFVSETFWKLSVEHTKGTVKAEFHWNRNRLFDRDVVNVLYDDCREIQAAVIENVDRKPKSRYRPYALDTVEMEKLAVRKLKMSAKTAMSVAEKLYSKGWISYPRTETNKFPAEIDLGSLVQMQATNPDWGNFASEIMEKGTNPRNGTKSDEAHPPIHPLKFGTRNQLEGNEWRLYELIVRHFLACVSWDAKGFETKCEMKIGDEYFTTTGLEVVDLGYMRVYVYDKWSDRTVPNYVQGEQITDFQLKISDGNTQPPSLLNEADLIALMDKFGIGTDATHAEHIEKIKERQYVGVRDDGLFIPGYLGLALVDGYDDMGYAMSKPQLRADLEKQLQEICNGTRTRDQVINEQKGKYKRIFEHAEVHKNHLSNALSKYLNNNPNAVQSLAVQSGSSRRGGGTSDRGRGGRGGRTSRGPEVAQIPNHNLPAAKPQRRPRNSRGASATAAAPTSSTVSGPAGGTTSGRGRAIAPGQQPLALTGGAKVCTCGLEAVQRTVNKEGTNKGRVFWTCPKPFGQVDKCNFFEWVN